MTSGDRNCLASSATRSGERIGEKFSYSAAESGLCERLGCRFGIGDGQWGGETGRLRASFGGVEPGLQVECFAATDQCGENWVIVKSKGFSIGVCFSELSPLLRSRTELIPGTLERDFRRVRLNESLGSIGLVSSKSEMKLRLRVTIRIISVGSGFGCSLRSMSVWAREA